MVLKQMAEKAKTIDKVGDNLPLTYKGYQIKQVWRANQINLKDAGLWTFTEKRDRHPVIEDGVLIPFLRSARVEGELEGRFINGKPVRVTNYFLSQMLHILGEEDVEETIPLKPFSKAEWKSIFAEGYDQAGIKDQWLISKAKDHW
jgi:hypothetical protein